MLEIILAATIGSGDFSVDVEKVSRRSAQSIQVLYKLQNNTPKRFARVHVNCVLFGGDGKALEIARGIAANVREGATVYEEATAIADNSVKPVGVKCDVSQAAE